MHIHVTMNKPLSRAEVTSLGSLLIKAVSRQIAADALVTGIQINDDGHKARVTFEIQNESTFVSDTPIGSEASYETGDGAKLG